MINDIRRWQLLAGIVTDSTQKQILKENALNVTNSVGYASQRISSLQKEGEALLKEKLGNNSELSQKFISNRIERDKDKAHITIIFPGETRTVIDKILSDEMNKTPPNKISKGQAMRSFGEKVQELGSSIGLSDSDIEAVGLGGLNNGTNETWFMVLNWPSADQFRINFADKFGIKLGKQNFHITVGFNSTDVHGPDITKDASALDYVHDGRFE